MTVLIPIRYKHNYPYGINPKIEEIAAHFDKEKIKLTKGMDYSLHTEYCYDNRKMDSVILKDLSIIRESHRGHIPQLWRSKEWVIQFHHFLQKITFNLTIPKIIEIHPPFNDYCNSIADFLDLYSSFEEKLLDTFKGVQIFLENRCGTRYKGGKFLISKTEDLIDLSRQIDKLGLDLRIAFDFPQLVSGYNIDLFKIRKDDIENSLKPLREIRHNIKAIHMWGKKLGKKGRFTPHIGDLNTYFSNNQKLKHFFLEELKELLNDNKSRYFVPEVNHSNDDFLSIINDLIKTGFKFI